MAFNQRLIVVQIPINAREKRKRKKRSFAHFVFNFCSFRFCDYKYLENLTSIFNAEMGTNIPENKNDTRYLDGLEPDFKSK